MPRNLSDAQVNELVDHLRGTALTLYQGLQELFNISEEEMTIEDCQCLDNKVFECELCGWWCSDDEDSGSEDQIICRDCDIEEST